MNGWSVAARIARRELRSGFTGFRIFLACLVIGVAAIAMVGGVSRSMVSGLSADARALLGGDVEITERHRPPGPEALSFIGDRASAVSQTVEMRAMARNAAGDARMLVELKAVDSRYPLVGSLDLSPILSPSDALSKRNGIWGAVVEANVLDRLKAEIGTDIRVGEATFRIRAVIDREPDRVTGLFSLGPRFMIAADSLPETELIQPGSQTRNAVRVLLPASTRVGPWMADLQSAFPEEGWRVRGTDEAAPGARRFIDRMTMFLSFAGLTALLVAGIGVAGSVRSYLDGRMRTIAILKCLGAERRLVFRVYLIQIGALGFLAVLIGLALGAAIPVMVLRMFGAALPVAPVIGVYAEPLATAAGFGILTILAFSLWPLALAANVSASDLFRQAVAPLRGRPGLAAGSGILASGTGLALLTVGAADKPLFALWFILGSLGALLILSAGAWALRHLAVHLRPRRSAALRLAFGNLHRPGAPTHGVVVSIGLGAAVLVAVALVEGNLSRQIADRLPEEAPALFFLDIQPDQVAGFEETIDEVDGTSGLERRPTLRGRITTIGGRPVDEIAVAYDAEWAIRGDRALTYAADPSPDSRIVEGSWWSADYKGPPLISLDANLARGFGIGIGDTLGVNILGREVTGTIASLREIDWRSLRFDFAIIYSPGILEGAPQTHIAAVHATPRAENAVERLLAERFPNISTVRVRNALETAARVVAGVAAAIRGSALVTLAAGILVVAGAIAAGRRRRLHDAVVFKVLGATRRDVILVHLAEHGILGCSAGVVALVVGAAASWAIVRFIMGFSWTFLPVPAIVTVVACVAVAALAGLVETWRVLGRKAAPLLRND